MHKQKKILIAPLDWGMGHATRCIPLIASFIQNNCDVLIAGNEQTNALIKEQFPSLTYLHLAGYDINYSTKKWTLPFVIGFQIPKIIKRIITEHFWLKKIIKQHQIDAVVSDNRYGLFTKNIPSIFITHQIQIQVPQSIVLQKLVNTINHFFIRQFTTCWVPDAEQNRLSGNLSIAKNVKNIQYIGILSRLEIMTKPIIKYDIAIVLSGPEPQRTILENSLLQQMKNTSKRVLFVRGKANTAEIQNQNENLTIISYASGVELQEIILSSEIVMSRAGYSTIMDLVKLNKHGIIIPTPGQTEQEYLGEYLQSKKWFLAQEQSNLDIEKALLTYSTFSFEPLPMCDTALLQNTIQLFIKDLN